MKTTLIITSIVLILFIALQSYTTMASQKTEQQAYTVIKDFGDFEIRFYPDAMIASVQMDGKTYKEISGPGFRKLANYIFGGNENNTQIPMTAPVHMNMGENGSTMSFVMPSGYSTGTIPSPQDTSIRIRNTGEQYVAALSFGGWASDEKIQFYSKKLNDLCQAHAINKRGEFSFLGYNPPYQLFGRRNDIVVTIEWPQSTTPE